ncbi:hypothetical protein OPQ81_003640 [Rhizoctonia solani]|nr:hypothetical protein OPQ81_003640 [Rhizoctonia solani]
MPAVRQHDAEGSSSVVSHGISKAQSNGKGAKNVWFYMTGAKTPSRPSDEDIQRHFDEDNQRQRTGLTYQRPQESRIRCVVCLLEKDKWQTWHNRPGPIAKILRQHLDGRHAIICTDDAGDPSAEPQQPTDSHTAKDKPASVSSYTKSSATEKSQPPVEAPLSTHSNATSQSSSSKLPTPTPESPDKPQHGEPSQPRSQCERVKAERDQEARERRLLKEELRRLKESERVRDEELVRLSNLLSSSLQALVKKQHKS